MASDLETWLRDEAVREFRGIDWDKVAAHPADIRSRLIQVADALAAQAAEIERLRKALIYTGINLGAMLNVQATTDFLMGVPEEARLVVERLTKERDERNALAIRRTAEKADAEARANALAARVADLEKVLLEAREEILDLAHSRGSEVEGTDAEIVSFIDDALHPKAPAPAGEGGAS